MSERYQGPDSRSYPEISSHQRPLGGDDARYGVVDVRMAIQLTDIQRHPAFPVLAGPRHHGIAAPVGLYAGGVIDGKARGAGGRHQNVCGPQRLSEGCPFPVKHRAARCAVAPLSVVTAVAVLRRSVAIGSPVVHGGVAAVSVLPAVPLRRAPVHIFPIG